MTSVAPATSSTPTDAAASPPRRPLALGWTVALGAALVWVYWPTLEQMRVRWSQDPQYTHGYIVPLFAALVLWSRRDSFPAGRQRSSWWGAAALALAALLRVVGVVLSYEWVEAGSLIPAVAGAILLTGGPAVLRWAWPVFAFLLFVLPWPWQLDMALAHPLRRVATVSSTYLLQALGYPALARGNVIHI
ncbi:MAG: exosortase/archaeosortase family protein, partial [Gemmataceae bacterium]